MGKFNFYNLKVCIFFRIKPFSSLFSIESKYMSLVYNLLSNICQSLVQKLKLAFQNWTYQLTGHVLYNYCPSPKQDFCLGHLHSIEISNFSYIKNKTYSEYFWKLFYSLFLILLNNFLKMGLN